MRHVSRLVVCAALLSAGCSKKSSDAGKPLGSADKAALAGLAKSLEAIGSADASQQVVKLSEAFGEVTGNECFERVAMADASQKEQILVECGVICSPEVAKQAAEVGPSQRWAEVAKRCGVEKFGLKPGQEHKG
jgi:hypothetical protein